MSARSARGNGPPPGRNRCRCVCRFGCVPRCPPPAGSVRADRSTQTARPPAGRRRSGPGEVQRPAQLARSVGDVSALRFGQLVPLAMEAVFCYHIKVVHWADAPDQHGGRLSLRLCDQVETVVHPIDQVDVHRPRRGEERLGPRGAPVAIGVAGFVTAADVGFRFGDLTDQGPACLHPDQIAAQQGPGPRTRCPGRKILFQDGIAWGAPFLFSAMIPCRNNLCKFGVIKHAA